MQLPKVLLNLVADYSCPLDTPDAFKYSQYKSLKEWTISRQCVYDFGYKRVVKVNTTLHCCNGPAVQYMEDGVDNDFDDIDNGKFMSRGTKKWYQYGLLHREGGPAYIIPYESQEWYFQGKLHNTDGPAVVNLYGNRSKSWYQNGKLHRIFGPAYMCPADGCYLWYQHDICHRSGGKPSYIYQENIEWYENGQIIRTEEKNKFNIYKFMASFIFWYLLASVVFFCHPIGKECKNTFQFHLWFKLDFYKELILISFLSWAYFFISRCGIIV